MKGETIGGAFWLIGCIIILIATVADSPKSTTIMRQDKLEMEVNKIMSDHMRLYKHELKIKECQKRCKK